MAGKDTSGLRTQPMIGSNTNIYDPITLKELRLRELDKEFKRQARRLSRVLYRAKRAASHRASTL